MSRFRFRLDEPVEEYARPFDVSDFGIIFGDDTFERCDLALHVGGCREDKESGLRNVVVLEGYRLCATSVSTVNCWCIPWVSSVNETHIIEL